MRTRWLIDFDGCLCSTMNGLLTGLNERFATTYTLAQVTDVAEFWTSVPEPFVKWVWGPGCFDQPAFLDRMEPNPGAIDAIHALLATDCPVLVVTDRPAAHLPWVAAWLARHDVIVPVVSSADHDNDKSRLVEEYEISIVVEDSPLHASQFLQLARLQKLFLYTMPWNAALATVPPVERLSAWPHLTARIHEEHAA